MNEEREENEVKDLEESYTLLGELGRGGSAIVYRARDRALHREVAIKVVRPRLAVSGEEAMERLAREARTVARLQHPNIVTVHAVGRIRDGGLALVMQLIPGRTLKQALAEDGAFAPERAEKVVKDIADALAFAHANGVVHRDVKPENIFLDSNTGRALLSDFGIAHSNEFESRLTMDGATIGTPAYMSPEQIDGAPANARSDVYSLGLVAWEMLTNERPWEGEALYNVIFKQKNEDLPAIDSIRPGEVPPRLQYIIERMMQKRPSARWAGADGLLSALNNWVVPSDWRQWEESHRRRREAEKNKPRPKPAPVDPTSAATVRFVRPTEGVVPSVAPSTAIPSSTNAPTAAAVTANSAEDEAPSWATAEPRSNVRRWALAGGLLLLVGGGGVATYVSQRAANDNVAPAATLTDSRSVEMPIVAGPTTDSLGAPIDSTTRSPADSMRMAEAIRPDSVLADSLAKAARRAAAAQAAANRAAAAMAAGASGAPGAATVAAPVAAPTRPPTAPVAAATPAPGPAVEPSRGESVRATDDAAVVAAGGRHSCTLVSSKVYCWGANERGQLGDGDVESRETPEPIVGDLAFSQITTGLEHTCGISRGEAYCWGSDERGQLGDATTTSRSAPVRVSGSYSFRQLRAGIAHTCGLTTSGDVACWGANSNGQLGDGGGSTRSSPVLVGGGMRFISVTAGWNHSCALASDGSAWCWGANAGGQLGNGTRADARAPVAVAGGLKFTSIAAGGTHTCAVSEEGEAFCWGRNSFGQLGTGGSTDQPSPTRVSTQTRFVSVTAGGVHTCARTRGGQGWCWGRNVYGQLGDGSVNNRDTPARVAASAGFASLNATGAHTCGAATDGETYCWGFNVEGQLGDGTRNHSPRPMRVTMTPK